MLGADHHGYVGRYRALAAAYGDDPDVNLEILIGQLVNLFKDGKPLRMSKRAGTTVTLEELVEAIGADAGRYALGRFSTDSPIDLDLDLWAKRTSDNPVFYVQYAHARVSSLLRNAAELGLDKGDLHPELLDHDREGDLLGALGEFPRVVSTAAELREPHRVARYLEELAGTYHRFYDACRVLPARRRGADRHPSGAALAGRGHPGGAGERAATARRQRPRADVAVRRCAPTPPGHGPASWPTRACTPGRRPTSARSTRPCGRWGCGATRRVTWCCAVTTCGTS